MKNKVLLFISCILLVCVMVAAKFVNDEKKSENKKITVADTTLTSRTYMS